MDGIQCHFLLLIIPVSSTSWLNNVQHYQFFPNNSWWNDAAPAIGFHQIIFWPIGCRQDALVSSTQSDAWGILQIGWFSLRDLRSNHILSGPEKVSMPVACQLLTVYLSNNFLRSHAIAKCEWCWFWSGPIITIMLYIFIYLFIYNLNAT